MSGQPTTVHYVDNSSSDDSNDSHENHGSHESIGPSKKEDPILPNLPYCPPLDVLQKFKEWSTSAEITDNVAHHILSVMTRIRVVMLVDDSGSMKSRVKESIPGQKLVPNRYSPTGFSALQTQISNQTRWGEAQMAAASLCNLVTSVSPLLLHPDYRTADDIHGLDVWFLNRDGVGNVTQLTDLADNFAKQPSKLTPLISSTRHLIKNYQHLCEKGYHVLLLILGDGEPTDVWGEEWQRSSQLYRVFSKKHQNFHISFVECNDNEEEMAWMDSLDGRIRNFHNVDDYRLELMRVRHYRGESFRYTYNDYIITAVLSTFVPKYFLIDQAKSANIRMNGLPDFSSYNTTVPPFEWLTNPDLIKMHQPLSVSLSEPLSKPKIILPPASTTSRKIKKYMIPTDSTNSPQMYKRNVQSGCCILL